MAKVRLINPSAPEVAARNAINKMVGIRESRVGVLANNKQHAELALSEIARLLGERYGVIHAVTNRNHGAEPADEAVIQRFVESCDWVLVGSAD